MSSPSPFVLVLFFLSDVRCKGFHLRISVSSFFSQPRTLFARKLAISRFSLYACLIVHLFGGHTSPYKFEHSQRCAVVPPGQVQRGFFASCKFHRRFENSQATQTGCKFTQARQFVLSAFKPALSNKLSASALSHRTTQNDGVQENLRDPSSFDATVLLCAVRGGYA